MQVMVYNRTGQTELVLEHGNETSQWFLVVGYLPTNGGEVTHIYNCTSCDSGVGAVATLAATLFEPSV